METREQSWQHAVIELHKQVKQLDTEIQLLVDTVRYWRFRGFPHIVHVIVKELADKKRQKNVLLLLLLNTTNN